MTRSRSGRAAKWLLACVLAGACNEADVIARPIVVVGPVDAGLDCSLSAQLARHKLESGIGNIYLPDCELPITQTDSIDNLRWLVNIGIRSDTKARVCAIDPFHVWPEPPPPLAAKKIVFCPASCQALRDWLSCVLRDDPCAHHDEDDAGAFAFCRP
jgi:hypothetical protein